MIENIKIVEIHGCIICAKLFNLLVVYTPEGSLLDCSVTSPGGHIVQDDQNPLVACDIHTSEKVASKYKIWNKNKSR